MDQTTCPECGTPDANIVYRDGRAVLYICPHCGLEYPHVVYAEFKITQQISFGKAAQMPIDPQAVNDMAYMMQRTIDETLTLHMFGRPAK